MYVGILLITHYSMTFVIWYLRYAAIQMLPGKRLIKVIPKSWIGLYYFSDAAFGVHAGFDIDSNNSLRKGHSYGKPLDS